MRNDGILQEFKTGALFCSSFLCMVILLDAFILPNFYSVEAKRIDKKFKTGSKYWENDSTRVRVTGVSEDLIWYEYEDGSEINIEYKSPESFLQNFRPAHETNSFIPAHSTRAPIQQRLHQ